MSGAVANTPSDLPQSPQRLLDAYLKTKNCDGKGSTMSLNKDSGMF